MHARLFRSLLFTLIPCAAIACAPIPERAIITAPPTLTMPAETSPMPTTSSATPLEEAWQSLDLRFAQVLDVSYERISPSQVQFNVTLVHDDDAEAPQYADGWQVEDLEGTILGKRILTHAHGTQPFTRSVTIDLPPSVDVVMIRGHDMRHGFGGQVIKLDMHTGSKEVLADLP